MKRRILKALPTALFLIWLAYSVHVTARHAGMTEAQLLINFWPQYLVSTAGLVAALFLVSWLDS